MTNLQEILVLVDSYRFDLPYFTYIAHIHTILRPGNRHTMFLCICFFTRTAFPTMNSLWTVILVLLTPFSIITGPTWTYKDWLIQNLFYQMLISSLQTGKDWQTPQSGRGRYVAFRFFYFQDSLHSDFMNTKYFNFWLLVVIYLWVCIHLCSFYLMRCTYGPVIWRREKLDFYCIQQHLFV